MKLRIVRLVSTAAIALTMTACGQKGPLYLPEKEAPATAETTAAEAADEAQNKDQADTTDQ